VGSGVPRKLLENVALWIEGLVGEGSMRQSITDLIGLAYRSVDAVFREEEAVQWAAGYEVPSALVEKGLALFGSAGFKFDRMVKDMKGALARGRISVESVHAVISVENPEKEKLLELVKGMRLLVEESFVPNGHSRPGLSNTYKKVAPAVNKMMCEDFAEGGLAVVLPVSVVESRLTEFHVSRLSWTPKSGKVKGRPILDCSAGLQSLNSPETKAACDVMWGSISHPRIGDLVRMILSYWRESGAEWEELTLWKVDLRGAYTLLSFEDAAVRYVGAEMTGGLIIFFLCGVFGWSGIPASFQVVSRALKFEIARRIKGADLYVDDIFGVSKKGDVEADIAKVVDLCQALFQSDCIEASKTVVVGGWW
jgi:hypothetical protein